MKHLRYLRYLLLHKWYVFVECCKVGMPIRGMIHDWQKFLPAEWLPYADYYYGGDAPTVRIGGAPAPYSYAWLHHLHFGPHHWQYWILRNDDGTTAALDMPLKYRKEMLCDWRGAGKAIHGVDRTQAWYVENRPTMMLHENTRIWIEGQLGLAWPA